MFYRIIHINDNDLKFSMVRFGFLPEFEYNSKRCAPIYDESSNLDIFLTEESIFLNVSHFICIFIQQIKVNG